MEGITAGGVFVLSFFALLLALGFGIGVLLRALPVTRDLAVAREVLREAIPCVFFGAGIQLKRIAAQPLFNVLDEKVVGYGLKKYLELPIGSAFEIIRAGDRTVREIVWEIQVYAVVLGFLFAGYVAMVALQQAISGDVELMKILYAVGSEPSHAIEFPACILMIALFFRLYSETKRWRSLLDRVED